MYFKFLVPVPVNSKIVKQTKNGVTYIDYEWDRTYDKELGYTKPRRSTIGKQSPDDPSTMWPNQNYLKYFPNAELPETMGRDRRSSCLRIGGYVVIEKMLEKSGIPELLSHQFKEADKGLFLDLVAYSILTENNAGQYYPDYAFNHPLFTRDMALYTDTKISEFLHSITAEQRIGFLNEWNAQRDHRERIYISYDATNKNCQAGEVDFAEYGFAKDDPSKPIINYSVAYDTENKEPLWYEEYPGSINDMSQLRYTVWRARGYGYKHIGFILDRGYFDRKNFEYMDDCGYSFIILLKGHKPLARELILEKKGTFEKKRSCYIREEGVAGTTIKRKMFDSDKKERYFHLYYSISRESRERHDLEEELKKMADAMKRQEGREYQFSERYETYYNLYYQTVTEKVRVIKEDEKGKTEEENQKRKKKKKEEQPEEKEIIKQVIFLCGKEKEDVVEAETDLQGYFVLITSEEMTAEQALRRYHSRDTSEKLFRADKSFLENHSYRVHSNESVAAKVFVAFIALIIRNRIFNARQDEMKILGTKPNFMTVPAALRELEKIEMVRLTDNIYHQDHAVTKTQKTILNAFNMDADYITHCAEKLQNELRRITDDLARKGA